MGRKRCRNKIPIPSNIRVKMFRQRQKLKRLRQLQLGNEQNENTIEPVDPIGSSAIIKKCLNDELVDWVNSFNISRSAVDSLLSILKPHLHSLPKSSKTLLKTPMNVEIKETAGGNLWYHGLAKSLEGIFSTLNRVIDISLNFNVDGLPLYNSSNVNFWPILGNIHGKDI